MRIKVGDNEYTIDLDEPLTVKDFVFYTGHSRSYFSAMKRAGFVLERQRGETVQTATYREYLDFHERNPHFRIRLAYPRKRQRC